MAHGVCYKIQGDFYNHEEQEDDESIVHSCIDDCFNKRFKYARIYKYMVIDAEKCMCCNDYITVNESYSDYDTTKRLYSTTYTSIVNDDDVVTTETTPGMTAVYVSVPLLLIILVLTAFVILLLWRLKHKERNTTTSRELDGDHVSASRHLDIINTPAEHTEIQLDDQRGYGDLNDNVDYNYIYPDTVRNVVDECNQLNSKSGTTSNKKSTYSHINFNSETNMNRHKVGSPYSHIVSTKTNEVIFRSDLNNESTDHLQDDHTYDHANVGSSVCSAISEKVDTYSYLHDTSVKKKKGSGLNYTINCQDKDLKEIDNYDVTIHGTPEYYILEDPTNTDITQKEMTVDDNADEILNHEYCP